MHGKASDTAVRSGGRAATKEQLRIAQVTQEGADEDRSRVQKMIKEIVETTRCTLAVAELALHDASNNVELAVNNILESDGLDTWTYNRKGAKKEEVREEPVKKGGNRGPRRGNQNQREQKGTRAENGAEGRENRQPRNKEDGEFRGKRDQQPRNRREQGGKRDGKKPNAEAKNESEDHWKNGPLVFNRRENFDDEKETQQVSEPIGKVTSKPLNAPLSFADVVRRNAQKPQPPPPSQQPVASESQYNLQVSNDAKQAPPSPHSLSNADVLDENTFGLPETSKSPRQLGHHLDVESAGGLLQDDPSTVTFGAQPSPQKMHQSLTEQLKTDLGLGASNSTSFGTSPPKKFHEPLHQNKAVKAGVVEFLSGDVPAATSGDWQFGFDAAPQPNTISDEHNQFRRDNVSKVNEPTRNDIGLPSSNINESGLPRGNASTVLNQYQQQQSSQYGASSHQQQQQTFNNRNNRNGVNNLPFSNNYSDNFNSDLRSSYGAPSSPPKTQSIQQPLQNLASQQQTHHHQQPIFPPYPSYPYMNMYSPVAPGIRDDYAPTMLPFQYQSGLDALMMIPQLNATSAGQLPSHQAQHHQNPPQQNVQQGLQHNQSSHSLQNQQQNHQRNDHFSDMKFLNSQMSIPPSSQNNGANGHNSQQNSNLGNNSQQRQQLLDNSQNSVAPPPGFPFFARNSFQVPAFTQFPYVMPNAQHKSK